jgi:uncharacterized protein (TIGR02270 family)
LDQVFTDARHRPESSVAPDQYVKPFISNVVRQHAEDAAGLYNCRTALVQMPHVRMRNLGLNDDRLAAHLDGLSVAGQDAWSFCEAALDAPSAGAVFAAAVRTIEDRRQERLDRLLALSEAVPETRSGLLSAFGWLEREQLQGIVVSLLDSSEPFRRMVGIAACAMHRVDPGLVSARRLVDSNPLVRARALRTAGEIGCAAAAPACESAIGDDDPECRFWAAWSSVLLGNRAASLGMLASAGIADSVERPRAFRVALQAMSTGAAHESLRQLAQDPKQLRWLIQGSGIAGDPAYMTWLIGHMVDEKTARIAGEAFSLITGVDFVQSGLEGKPPEGFVSGPADDPDDPNVEMDPDEGLSWPDVAKIEKWWSTNGGRFQKGTRYFMGAPVTREHCIDVLKNGYQRQRILAAHYLCVLEPGTPLFNTSAPAWRQQRLLAKMT